MFCNKLTLCGELAALDLTAQPGHARVFCGRYGDYSRWYSCDDRSPWREGPISSGAQPLPLHSCWTEETG
jgi:hypothetical protein